MIEINPGSIHYAKDYEARLSVETIARQICAGLGFDADMMVTGGAPQLVPGGGYAVPLPEYCAPHWHRYRHVAEFLLHTPLVADELERISKAGGSCELRILIKNPPGKAQQSEFMRGWCAACDMIAAWLDVHAI